MNWWMRNAVIEAFANHLEQCNFQVFQCVFLCHGTDVVLVKYYRMLNSNGSHDMLSGRGKVYLVFDGRNESVGELSQKGG